MPSVTPFLWYNANAQDIANFYASVFKDAKIKSASPQSAQVELNGQQLYLFNGGSHFTLNEAASLFVGCDTQDEIDYYWNALQADGGSPSRCGWLKDKFGLSWQVVPTILLGLLTSGNAEASKRAHEAMLSMNKLVIADLQEAFDGK